MAFSLLGCNNLPEPGKVKKVEDCVAWFKSEPDPTTAKAVARGLIEENALLDRAVQAACECHGKVEPTIRGRNFLVSESLTWINTWDNQGKPPYLGTFFTCFSREPEAIEARKGALETLKDRLSRIPLDSGIGLRAIVGILEKSIADQKLCVAFEGFDEKSKQIPLDALLDAFAAAKDPNPWRVSGLQLEEGSREGCTGLVQVQAFKGSAKVTISRADVLYFEKSYSLPAIKQGSFAEDFKIP